MPSFQAACSAVALLLVLLQSADCQYSPVCDPDAFLAESDADIVPSLPDQFSIVVEANFVNNGSTVTVSESFDSIGNRGKIEFTGRNGSRTGIVDYNTQEIFLFPSSLSDDDGACVVSPIAPDTRAAMVFGFTMVNGTVHIGSPRTAFEKLTNASVSQYQGSAVVRGIDCEQWTTCVNMENNSYTIDYYFSSNWSYSGNDADTPVPVQFVLNASRLRDDGTVYNFTNIYSFIDFKSGPDSVPDSSFVVPAGLVCQGRAPGIALPTLPSHFSFSTEFADSDRQTVGTSREYYDLDQRLFRLDIYYDGSFGGAAGPISIVHDFNLETQYTINHRFANCSVSQLTPSSPFVFFDASLEDDPSRPSLATPNQILFVSNDFNYTYEGVTSIRGVDVDSWISVRDFEQFGFGTNISDAVFEVYFTRPGWRISSQTGFTEEPIPWAGSLTGVITFFNRTTNMTESRNFSSRYDILSYSTEEPSFDIYDTSICTNVSDYIVLSMFFRGQEAGMGLGQLRRSVRAAIVDYTGVTPLQVGNIQIVAENGTHIFVIAHISNISALAIADPSRTDVTAKAAVNMILQDISDQRLPFQLTLPSGATVQLYLLEVSTGEGSEESCASGYPPYAIAAIVIMFLIGIVLGILATLLVGLVVYCVRKRMGRGAVTVGTAKYEKQQDDVIVS